MKAAKSALLLTVPALMVGCGGGSGGSSGGGSTPSTPKYNIDFVALKSVTFGTEGNCAIYGTNSGNTKSYIAQKAQGANIKLHIHSSDGTWKSSYQPTSGTININQSLVQDGDYISIVSTSRGGIYDILTIEKDFIPTRFTVNTFNDWDSRVSCNTEIKPSTTDYNGYIDDEGDGNGFFVFRSTTDDQESTSPNNIAYNSVTNKEVLAARLCRSTSGCSDKDLMQYRFIAASATQDSNNPVDLVNVTNHTTPWYTLDGTDTTLNSAKLNIYRQNSGAILWQSLPLTDGTYSYAAELSEDYYVHVKATHKTWNTEYTKHIENPDNGINELNSLTDLNMPTPASSLSLVSSCGLSVTSFCLNGYNSAAPTTMDLQRSTLYAVENNGNKIHQTIYGKPNLNQPLMAFEDSNIDAVWANAALNKKEVSLFETSDDQEVELTFISSNFNAEAVENNGYQTTSDVDTISIIRSQQENSQRQAALAHQDSMAFSQAFIAP
ncbi:hypothetical protein ACUALS_00995 [Vibrio sp. NH-7]